MTHDAWAGVVRKGPGMRSEHLPPRKWHTSRALKDERFWEGLVAQSVKHPTSAQVTISRFEPCIGLAAISTDPASDPVSPSLPFPAQMCALTLSLKN